mgnify:CR=1 FL=1
MAEPTDYNATAADPMQVIDRLVDRRKQEPVHTDAVMPV